VVCDISATDQELPGNVRARKLGSGELLPLLLWVGSCPEMLYNLGTGS